jgi:hypothetical protein
LNAFGATDGLHVGAPESPPLLGIVPIEVKVRSSDPVTRKYYADMTSARRDAFKATAQTPCSWWAKRCSSLNRRSGQTIDLPPGEMFAEMYEACAMGMTREQVADAGFNSYGWEPPDGSEP